MEKSKKILDTALYYFCTVILVSMVCLALWQVWARYVMAEPSTTSEETVRLLLIWLAICGGAYAFGQKAHLAIDTLFKSLPTKYRPILGIIIHCLTISLIILVFLVGGMQTVWNTRMQMTPALQMPVSFLYLSMPVGGLFSLFYEVYNISVCAAELKK